MRVDRVEGDIIRVEVQRLNPCSRVDCRRLVSRVVTSGFSKEGREPGEQSSVVCYAAKETGSLT